MDYAEFRRKLGIPVPGEKAARETPEDAAGRLNNLAGLLRALAEEKGVAVTAGMGPEAVVDALRAAGKPEETVPEFDLPGGNPVPSGGTGKKPGKGK